MLSLLTQVVAGPDLRETWRLADLPEAWVIVLLVLPGVFLLSWLGYRHQGIAPRWRFLLGGLRAGAVLLLLVILARPVLIEHREEVEQAEVLVLLDDSASMRRRDTYAGEDRERLDRLDPRPLRDCTRIELARTALETTLLPALRAKGYRPRAFAFSDGLTPLADLRSAEGRGNATHIGDALHQAGTLYRGHHVTDLVLVSDGRSNGGRDVLRAADALGGAGIVISTAVVGDLRREKNTSIELVEAPSQTLEGDEIAITLRVRGSGFGDGDASRGHVILEELDVGSASGDDRGVPVAEEITSLSEDGERLVVVAPPGEASPTEGLRRFRARIIPAQGETLLDDNSVEFSVRVTPEKVRVLYVDGYPRWEYRYLKNLLLRSDARLDCQCFLLSATADFVQESSDGLPPLVRVPTERRELLDNYDVVILGDVNPYSISPDPARGEAFVASLTEFVERGGGLLVIAGEYDMPRSVAGTAFASLLPVVLDKTGALGFEGDTRVEFRPLLEDPASPHSIVRLHPDVATNQRLWEEEGGLRGFYWYAPVVRARPGAQVLLRHPTHSGSYGRRPLLVVGYHPAGRALFLAVDSTWRWRYRFVDRYHDRFWRNAIRWLALGRLRGGDRRFQLESVRGSWDLGERITLEARVLDEDFRPSGRKALPVRVTAPDGKTRQETLQLQPQRPGLFRLSLSADRPGTWTATLEESGKTVARTEFTVRLPSRENADPTPDPELLSAAAALTGGRAVSLAYLEDLLDEFPGNEERRHPISSRLEDAWDRWATLLLALALLTSEWVLRKRLELV
jgi:uncharacterized membrane protein